MYRVLVVCLAVLTACGPFHSSRLERLSNGKVAERIYNNLGGVVNAEKAAWKQRVRAHKIDHFIVDGMCASFCSFVALYAPDSCYTKNVAFFVHPASVGGLIETARTQAFTESAVRNWPKGLQKWWYENRPGVAGVTLYYKDLIKIIPEKACKTSVANGQGSREINARIITDDAPLLASERPRQGD